ncbi:MAG: response regulator transcription factor [Prevotellaceae bacterium]|jgi:DNA-binding NarL/FixJ family response regulator|nr:response regulator transcription factor [Prevotellaceae bacterium]
MRTFILADNQDITREGLLSIIRFGYALHYTPEIKISSSRKELMEQLMQTPDAVVVLDYTLFDFTDVQLINLRQRYPRSAWILFSDELSNSFLRQVLHSDLQISVVMKTDSLKIISLALQRADKDEVFLCDLAEQVLREGVPPDEDHYRLTASEKLVLREIALGKTTKEIAHEQNLSFHTINAHRKNIFRKLEINNVHEAVKYALRSGILDLAEYYM